MLEAHNVRSRGPSDDIHLDLHILVDPDTPLAEAHRSATASSSGCASAGRDSPTSWSTSSRRSRASAPTRVRAAGCAPRTERSTHAARAVHLPAMRRPHAFLFACTALLIPTFALAADAGHSEPSAGPARVRPDPAGRAAGRRAVRALRLPAVLGELIAGIVLGNLELLGFPGFEPLRIPILRVLAQIGVLFLLFEVGLESNVAKMVAVGLSSLVVAVLGVIAPMVLGYFVTRWFFPEPRGLANWFVAPRCVRDQRRRSPRACCGARKTASRQGRIILGAAVIDDVLGLIVLAVVRGRDRGRRRGGRSTPATVLSIVGKAVLFLGGAARGRALALAPRVRARRAAARRGPAAHDRRSRSASGSRTRGAGSGSRRSSARSPPG